MQNLIQTQTILAILENLKLDLIHEGYDEYSIEEFHNRILTDLASKCNTSTDETSTPPSPGYTVGTVTDELEQLGRKLYGTKVEPEKS
jgi:hypothetical protein